MSALQQFKEHIYDQYRTAFRPKVRLGHITLLADRRLSRPMRETLYRGEYEERELSILNRTLQPTDRVLELGGGLGLLSITCAKLIGSGNVTSLEANPEMEPIIRANYAANGVSPNLIMAMAGPAAGSHEFHIRKNFWASSGHDGRRDGAARTLTVPVRSIDNELRATKANYLIVDIEGGEIDLFNSTTLPGVSKLLIEMHPDVIRETGMTHVTERLRSIGFTLDRERSHEREWYLSRQTNG